MVLAAIVSEYNPFHKGHQFHIEETRRITGADGVIAVMSGSFVQRGEGAIFSKEIRANAAICGGADLVLELAPTFAVQSAERFARGALKIITSIPEVKYLSFGAEDEGIDNIKRAAEILACEPEEYKAALKEELLKGISYPEARQNAFVKIGEKEAAEVLSQPNNILGVEYLKALKRFNSKILPVAIKRKGAVHDSKISGEFSSASFLRDAFYSGDIKAFESGIPEESAKLFNNQPYLNKENFEKMILSRIISMSEAELKEISEVSEGLENRIRKAALSAKTLEELAQSVKTKRYTMSKVRRILLCAGLGIKKEEAFLLPPYAKILAFNENGQKILNTIKKTSEIPIIKNMTALKKLGDSALIRQYERETELDRLFSIYTEEK